MAKSMTRQGWFNLLTILAMGASSLGLFWQSYQSDSYEDVSVRLLEETSKKDTLEAKLESVNVNTRLVAFDVGNAIRYISEKTNVDPDSVFMYVNEERQKAMSQEKVGE